MPDNSRNVTNIADLDPMDREIISTIISEPAISYTELGKRLSCDRTTIRRRAESPEVKAIISDHQISVIQYKKDLQYKAMKKLEELLDCIEPQISLGAAKEIVRDMEPKQVDLNVSGDTEILEKLRKIAENG